MRKGEREQKTVSALVAGHNRQEGSPPHSWDCTSCFLFHPRGTVLTFILVCQNHSSPTSCICACACLRVCVFRLVFQNLKHTIASVKRSCYIFYPPFSAYIFHKFNTPLKLTFSVIKTPTLILQSGLLPLCPPVHLPPIISHAALNACGFWSKQLAGFYVTHTFSSKSLKFSNTRQYISWRKQVSFNLNPTNKYDNNDRITRKLQILQIGWWRSSIWTSEEVIKRMEKIIQRGDSVIYSLHIYY